MLAAVLVCFCSGAGASVLMYISCMQLVSGRLLDDRARDHCELELETAAGWMDVESQKKGQADKVRLNTVSKALSRPYKNVVAARGACMQQWVGNSSSSFLPSEAAACSSHSASIQP